MAALSNRRLGALPRLPLTRGLAAGLALFGAVLLLLLAAGAGSGSKDQRSEDRAVAAALRDAPVRFALAQTGYTRYRVTPVDDQLTRVSFFEGPRIVFDAAVAPDGSVRHKIPYTSSYNRIGSEIGENAFVLLGLSLVFVLAAAGTPRRSRRNRDVAALAALTVPVVLVNARLLELSVFAAAVPLAYLGWRCLRVALAPVGESAEPTQPLWEHLTAGLDPRARRRALGLTTGAAAIVLVLLSIPGGLVSDVAFASMAGATDLLHGTLPYGHLPQTDLVHGDTYPLVAYVLYMPAALVSPVHGAFDNLDGSLYVTAAFALSGAAALYRVGRRFAAAGDRLAGMRMALAWMAFPPVMIAASSGSNDVVAAALVAWALVGLARPGWSALAITLAGWVKLAPFLLMPAWILRNGRQGRLRALAAVLAASAVLLVWVLALGGVGGLGDMIRALSFQAERGSLLSPWALIGAGWPQATFQAAVVTLVVVSAVRLWRDRAGAVDPRRLAAMCAAILIGVQLAANYWTYTYLVWVFPLVALALLSEPPGPARSRAGTPASLAAPPSSAACASP